jgi:hypothetical protein
MKVGNRLTKNLYRREWRCGGVTRHDTPLDVDRLIGTASA